MLHCFSFQLKQSDPNIHSSGFKLESDRIVVALGHS